MVSLASMAVSTFGADEEWPEVFTPTRVINLYFEIDPIEWDRFKHDPEDHTRLTARMRSDGETNLTVQINEKGGSYFGNDRWKVAFKVDINTLVPGQEWRSLRKLSLELGAAAEGIAWQLYRMAYDGGFFRYPVGYASWVKVFVNGEYEGLYVNVEQRDEAFLRNRGMYREGASWLYKYWATLETGIGDSPTLGFLCFSPFAYEPTCPIPETFEADVQRWLDVDHFLTLAAVEAFMGNGDGALQHGNGFYADFLPPTQLRRLYFPWDLDSGFGYLRPGSVNSDIYTVSDYGTPGPFQILMLGHPWFRQRFQEILQGLLLGPFNTNSLKQYFNGLDPMLRPLLESDPVWEPALPEFQSFFYRLDDLREWLLARVPIVQAQLPTLMPLPQFSHNGGEIVPGFELVITNAAGSGTIYFTTNGIDPRAPGGSITGQPYTGPVRLNSTRHAMARVRDGTNWSGLREATFNVSSEAAGLRITEIMYAPLDAFEEDDGHNFEFIELKNFSSNAVDLSRFHFTGIDYTFERGKTVPPGGMVLLVKNPAYFPIRYPGVPFDGVYWRGLSRNGERIRLRNSDERTITSVTYDDAAPWPQLAAGAGHSLVFANPSGDPSAASNWKASARLHGSPGRDETDDIQVEVAFEPGNVVLRWTSKLNAEYRVQWSADLVDWTSFEAILPTTNSVMEFRDPSAPGALRRFYRIQRLSP